MDLRQTDPVLRACPVANMNRHHGPDVVIGCPCATLVGLGTSPAIKAVPARVFAASQRESDDPHNEEDRRDKPQQVKGKSQPGEDQNNQQDQQNKHRGAPLSNLLNGPIWPVKVGAPRERRRASNLMSIISSLSNRPLRLHRAVHTELMTYSAAETDAWCPSLSAGRSGSAHPCASRVNERSWRPARTLQRLQMCPRSPSASREWRVTRLPHAGR